MEKKVDLKEDYPIHFRIALLIVIIGWIIAFVIIPKTEVKPYESDFKIDVKVEKLPPQLKNIVEPPPPPKPKLPVAAKTDEEVQEQTIEKTDFTGFEKETEVDLPPPDFVPYDKAPQAVNLNQIQKSVTYPEIALKLRIEGDVWLKMWVDKKGDVRKVILVKSLYPPLDSIAIEAYKKLKFTPAMQRDIPVDVWVSMPFRWRINK